jgi:hypothetical protein
MVNGDSTGTALTNNRKESYDQCLQRKSPVEKPGAWIFVLVSGDFALSIVAILLQQEIVPHLNEPIRYSAELDSQLSDLMIDSYQDAPSQRCAVSRSCRRLDRAPAQFVATTSCHSESKAR